MKKKVLLLFTVFISVIFISSCGNTEPAKRKDIQRYVEDHLNLDSFSVAETPVEEENESSPSDLLWLVTTEDFGFSTPLEFYVIDSLSFGKFGAHRNVGDNLDGTIKNRIIDEFNMESNLPDEFKEGSNLYYVEDPSTYSNHGKTIHYNVSHRSDFRRVFPYIKAFQEHLKSYKNLDDFSFYVTYDFKSDGPASFIEDEMGTVLFTASTSLDELESSLSEIGNNDYECGSEYYYLITCMQNGLRDRIQEFSEDEIRMLIEGCEDVIEVTDLENNILKSNIVYADNKKEISIGNLYELLPEKEGEWYDYTFTDANNQVHHFSYDGISTISVDEASSYLGLKVDDGFEVTTIVIPNSYFEYFDLDKNDFVERFKVEYIDCYRRCELKNDGLYIDAKPYHKTKMANLNDDKVDEIREKLRERYSRLWIQVNNSNQVYQGLDFTIFTDNKLKEPDFPLLNQALELTAFNHILYEKDGDWIFPCNIKYASDNNKVISKREFTIPNDKITFDSFEFEQRN